MALITLSRGTKSGGEALAKRLAESLGYSNIVSREVLLRASEEYGITERELTDAMLKPPRLLERSTHRPRRLYLTLIRAALLDYARSGDLIYHGNAGQFLLRELDWVLKVRLIASLEQRIAALQQSMNMDRFEATQYIKKVDDDRARWTKFLYDEDWSDPANFDLIVNLASMSLETAAQLICDLVRAPEFSVTEERLSHLADHTLAAKVQAALALNPRTADSEVIVSVQADVVRLSGKLGHSSSRPFILQIAQELPGVSAVVDNMIS